MKIWAVVLAVVFFLGFFMWSVDFVTLEGEWTIYTVQCQSGKWLEDACSGSLVAGERHRFRALKNKAEVVFWVVASPQPSGKLTACAIESRTNWKCAANAAAEKSLTVEMHMGRAVPRSQDESGAIHAVSKWRWYLLFLGIGS